MLATLDYPASDSHPEFTLALRVNFKSGVAREQFGFRFVGSDGVMLTSPAGVTVTTVPPEAAPGYSIGTFSKAAQEQFLSDYRKKYPERPPDAAAMRPEKQDRYLTPPGHDAHRDHHRAFYESIRAGKPSIEDAVFGFRAAGPALLANVSFFEKRICHWDPRNMTAS
jgi:hypothetical protein